MDTNDFCYPLEGLVFETWQPSETGFHIARGICTSCGQANSHRSIDCALISELWFFRQLSRMELCADCFANRVQTFKPTSNNKCRRGYFDWPMPPKIAGGYVPPRRLFLQEGEEWND